MATNVFHGYKNEIYKFRFAGRIEIQRLMGGTPSDPKVAEGWLKTKMGLEKEDILRQAVEEVMAARNVSEDVALKEVDKRRHLNGFKRERCDACPEDISEPMCATGAHPLYIEGRHMKAMLKEGANVARAANNLPARMGSTSKGLLSFIAEHVIVVDDILRLGQFDKATKKVVDVLEPTGVIQSFPKNPMTKQTGIQYTEHVDFAVVEFTIASDWEFSEKEWAAMWLTGGNQGIGASRSQGYGRFEITKWTKLS